MTTPRRILGISDSKSVFIAEHEQPRLLQLIWEQGSKATQSVPNICYIGAAKGDRPERAADFFALARRVGFHPSSLDLYAMKTGDPQAYFPSADAIFIDGGVTRNLIALFKEWDVIAALREAYQRGVLIAGASAGISMLFDWCISDSIKSSIQPVRGVGLLKGSICAHYDVLETRRTTLAKLLRSEPNALPAYGVEDGVAILFENEVFAKAYAVRSNAKLHQFKRGDHGITHTHSIAQHLEELSISDLGH